MCVNMFRLKRHKPAGLTRGNGGMTGSRLSPQEALLVSRYHLIAAAISTHRGMSVTGSCLRAHAGKTSHFIHVAVFVRRRSQDPTTLHTPFCHPFS